MQALLRPGRIDRMIYVPLPSHHTRKEIFKVSVEEILCHVVCGEGVKLSLCFGLGMACVCCVFFD